MSSEAERAFERWSEESGTIPACNLERDAFLAGYAAAEEQVCRRLIEEVDKIEGAEGGEGP